MKIIKLIYAAAAAVTLILSLARFAYAYEYSSESDAPESQLYPSDGMQNLIDSLPEDISDRIKDYSDAEGNDARSTALKDKLDIKYWISCAYNSLCDFYTPALGTLASLISVICAASLASHMIGTGSGTNQVYRNAVSLAAALVAANAARNAAQSTAAFISALTSMMNAMLPVMNTLMISSGSVTRASVSSSALMLYITVTENLCRSVLIPASGALLALTVISTAFKEINISSFTSSAKKTVIAMLGLTVTVFSFVLQIQSSLAGGSDTLTSKTVKFAVGSYVPIVGGAVADALGTVSASLSVIKHTCGGIGIVVILLMLIPTLTSLFLTRLAFSLGKFVSELLCADECTGIIECAVAVLDIFFAAAALSSVLFIFAITLFTNSGIM